MLALGLRYPIYITLFTEVNKLRSVASVYMLLDQLIASLDTVFAMSFLKRAEIILDIDSRNICMSYNFLLPASILF